MKFSISYWGQKIKDQAQKTDSSPKTLADYNREVLVKLGADQFKKLIDKGLNIPVALL